MSNSNLVPPSPGPAHLSKLPKFLHRHQARDRSYSLNEGPTSSGSESSSSAASGAVNQIKNRSLPRKTSKLFGLKEREERINEKWREESVEDDDFGMVDSPIIIESSSPPEDQNEDRHAPDSNISNALISNSFARPRTRSDRRASERPLSSSATMTSADLSSFQHAQISPAGARFTDIPSRLSGWFQNTFSTSTTDLSSYASMSSPLSQSLPASTTPPSAVPNKAPNIKSAASIIAHIPGTANIGKVWRRILDPVAQPDFNTDSIWLMGVEHPGYEASVSPSPSLSSLQRHDSRDSSMTTYQRRSTPPIGSRSSPPSSRHLSPTSQSLQTGHQTRAAQILAAPSRVPVWPLAFYSDFTSRIWMTYRSGYSPIRDITLASLEPCTNPDVFLSQPPDPMFGVSESPSRGKWTWPVGIDRGWSTDAGWGCMLRTGQSLLANALIHYHLGRDWRRPTHPSPAPEFTTYVKIITWFLDSPSPLCPFGVHRMALAGKDLGKDVGSWFGPSTAAGAIKTLVHAFSVCDLSVAVASDGVLFESEIYAASAMEANPLFPSSASHLSSDSTSPGKRGVPRRRWGSRAVLVLIGVRLGIDGVNPIYHESVKALFTFPQSVGISGGRPSSSYYFVGVQGDTLFYLDPHHTRPTVPLRYPSPSSFDSRQPDDESSSIPSEDSHVISGKSSWKARPKSGMRRQSTTNSKGRPEIPQRHRATAPPEPSSSPPNSYHSPTSPSPLSQSPSLQHLPPSTSIHSQLSSSDSNSSFVHTSDPLTHHYVTSYSMSELGTFHCDKVRKMPLASLDPSMLLGFLCRNEDEWKDFRERVDRLSKEHDAIFYIENEPTWRDDSDDDMGLESVSEPDTDHPSTTEEDFFDANDSAQKDTSNDYGHVFPEEEEEDVVTPGAQFQPTFLSNLPIDDRDDEDEWIDQVAPPTHSTSTNGIRSQHGPDSTPIIRQPHSPSVSQSRSIEQVAFPVTAGGEDSLSGYEVSPASRIPIRARNGGRTESGGVRGVPWKAGEEDWREF